MVSASAAAPPIAEVREDAHLDSLKRERVEEVRIRTLIEGKIAAMPPRAWAAGKPVPRTDADNRAYALLKRELAVSAANMFRLSREIAKNEVQAFAGRVMDRFEHAGLLTRMVQYLPDDASHAQHLPKVLAYEATVAGKKSAVSASYIRKGLKLSLLDTKLYTQMPAFALLYDPFKVLVKGAYKTNANTWHCKHTSLDSATGKHKLNVTASNVVGTLLFTDFSKYQTFADSCYGVNLPDYTHAGYAFKASKLTTHRDAPRTWNELLIEPKAHHTFADAIIGILFYHPRAGGAHPPASLERFYPQMASVKTAMDAQLDRTLPVFVYDPYETSLQHVTFIDGYGAAGGRRSRRA